MTSASPVQPVPIAATPAALTPEWLTSALAAGGHLPSGRITAVRAQPLGTGQMCDSVRLEIEADGDALPPTIVAKLPAADPTSRGTAISLRSYEKEVRFYRELAPTVAVATPKVLHADIDATGGSFVLLMEDMAPAQQGDQLAGCTPEAATAALDALTGLHAPRWGDPALHDLEWLAGDAETARASMAMVMPLLWQGFLDRYGPDLDEHVRPLGDAMFADFDAYLAPPTGPTTVVHGDFRLDNLLFAAGGTDVRAVVDWQTCTVGPALADVAYFIGAGLLPDVRRAHEEDLLRHYLTRLRDLGIEVTWTDAWHEYRRATFAGLVMAIGASMLVERTARGDEMFVAMAERHARHALDLDAADLLG